MARVFSGIKPSGSVQLGNLLGAMRIWAEDQHVHDSIFCLVDLHAITVQQDPAELRQNTLELAQIFFAVGLDPDIATLFVQSHVSEHPELSWLLECTVGIGELRRMTQFKDKSEKAESVSAGLFTYPALMAADIVLYDTDRVPVGDDQRQHLELTRDVAGRFNARYGDTFVIPEASIPPAGARVMDLQDPTSKMSKSTDSPHGTIDILDDPKSIEKKLKRAVTDTDGEIRYDVAEKPGISNLLSILAATTGRTPDEAAIGYTQYGQLKVDTAEAVVEYLRPIQERYRVFADDPGQVTAALAKGADKASAIAGPVLARAKDNMGLLASS